MRHTRLLSLAVAASAVLLAGCNSSTGGASASSTAPGPATGTVPPAQTSAATSAAPTPSAPPSVTKPAKDHFTVCDTKNVAQDAAGKSYCTTTAHETPEGAASMTCIADFAATDPKAATLQVTYSVFRQGRNVAYFRKIPAAGYTVSDFQVRYDFKPEDGKFWGDKTLPPGSYYCEWYTKDETKLGTADIVHGQLPSSTVGTPGAPY